MKSIHKIQNIIHIGANKTATTSFQDYLFSKIRKIGYIGNKQDQIKIIEKELKNLRSQDDFYYNPVNLKKIIKELKNKNIDTLLYSDEDILTSNNLTRCAKRLKNLLPRAKIVITIRNQISALESWYLSHGSTLKMVPKKYFRKYVSFDDWIEYCFQFRDDFVTPLQSSPLKAMDYNMIINIFAKSFGSKNIKILLYENLIHKKDEIFYDWSEILMVSEKTIRLKLLKKKFLRKSQNKRKIISGKNIKNIIKYFSLSNYLINKKYTLNLEQYNYPL
jgi:hypothetical protein